MKNLNAVALGGGLVLTCTLGGCADSAKTLPWQPDEVTVLQPGKLPETQRLPSGDACLAVADGPGDVCVRPQEQCEAGGAADVIVNEDGELLDVVCLPANAEVVSPAEVADGDIPQTENNTAVLFEDGTFEGDLSVDANKVVLYGDGPDEASIDGNLTLTGNNAAVRGLTIDGDVEITLNDATLVFCRITGDLTISGNNASVSGCEIFGDVTLQGSNNTALNGNSLGGTVSDGQNVECKDNFSFVDENENAVVEDEELGDRIDC